ncbi:hypothetical protein C0Z16_17750 [Paraburkholderia rhynchosiae]|uniref:Transposase InsH N-terminal domain-containing protein n=1 Tax=Paraburkholderia rhynchosiae TaxID=487049 RepID=A0ABX4V3Q9_9BURK|nr:hypothetical protein C0Z16_17750 [Paraburkholderia rhynchosiae]
MRIIDAFVEELDLASLGFEETNAASTGRPSYHPAVLLKIYISSKSQEREQRTMPNAPHDLQIQRTSAHAKEHRAFHVPYVAGYLSSARRLLPACFGYLTVERRKKSIVTRVSALSKRHCREAYVPAALPGASAS